MSCGWEKELVAYLDGEMDAAEADSLRRHLEECGRCRERLGLLEASYSALDHLETAAVPRGFGRRVQARTAARQRPVLRYFAGALAAAAVVLLALALRTGEVSVPAADPVQTAVAAGDITPEEAAVVENLDFLEAYDVLTELDILADYDMLVELDQLESMVSI